MAKTKNKDRFTKQLLSEKMRLLGDFGVCDYDDAKMRKKLEDAIAARPNVEPRIALDSYCRPLVQEAMDKWN